MSLRWLIDWVWLGLVGLGWGNVTIVFQTCSARRGELPSGNRWKKGFEHSENGFTYAAPWSRLVCGVFLCFAGLSESLARAESGKLKGEGGKAGLLKSLAVRAMSEAQYVSTGTVSQRQVTGKGMLLVTSAAAVDAEFLVAAVAVVLLLLLLLLLLPPLLLVLLLLSLPPLLLLLLLLQLLLLLMA